MGYSYGRRWTEDKVEEEINRVKNILGIDRRPRNREVSVVTGSSSLNNKISKSGGFRAWAKRLNLNVKNSETSIGHKYEFEIKEILEKLGYQVQKMTTKHPYDLLINDNVKIDVKVSRCCNNNGFKFYSFNLERKYHNCDIFICVTLDDNELIDKILVIPSKYLMDRKQLSIGMSSSYDKFNKCFDYIDKYIYFYDSI